MQRRELLKRLFKRPVRSTPAPRKSSAFRMTRRSFGKASVAMTLFSLLKACATTSNELDPHYIQISTRNPKGVRGVLESWPESGTKEMAFAKVKGKPGMVIPIGVDRTNNSIRFIPLPHSVRSDIHTHVPPSYKHVFSSSDLINFLEMTVHSPRREHHKYKHLGIMSVNGELYGYISIGRRQKLLRAAEHNDPELRSIRKELERLQKRAFGEEEYAELAGALLRLKKLGLLIHYTPMPGKEYKDQRFSPKN